jgi:hypothetical protein
MREIAKAKFLYVVDVNGYVGQSAATEMAYAALKGVPIITAEVIGEVSKDIPVENHELLKVLTQSVLPINAITPDSVEKLREGLDRFSLILDEEQKKQLEKLIKNLLKSLSPEIIK